MKKYSLGLDIGTNSIGWAVVDEKNQIVKKNNFALWGVRMMNEAESAQERRQHRSQRRRIQRRNQRLKWLKNEFIAEINKIDVNFFQRLKDSFFYIEDKEIKTKYTYFDDEKLEKEYYDSFPTIYHLRQFLINTDQKVDIRMVYLALHHIIKYRGNFLTEGIEYNKNDISHIKEIFDDFNLYLEEGRKQFEDEERYFSPIVISDDFFKKLHEIMLKSINKKEKRQNLFELFNVEKKSLVNDFIIPLLLGNKVCPNNFSLVKDFKYDKCEIDLSSESLEEDIENSKSTVKELAFFFDEAYKIKEVADYYYLLEILGNKEYISDAMVDCYNLHKNDLQELKELVKTYIPEKYNEMFKLSNSNLCNYPNYIGMNSVNGKMSRFKHCKKEEFYEYIKKVLNSVHLNDTLFLDKKEQIFKKIDDGKYLLRQNSGQNTAIPMQLNLQELKIILKNQSKHYPFLNESNGELTRIERIISIFEYHLPYYVGPLNSNSPYSWIIRKDEKITPWNYKNVIQFDETAKEFIQRMQNKCTYLHGENDYCLPKKSLLFSEYNCLQYLNRLTINGQLISKEMKDSIFEGVFLKFEKPTRKKIEEFLKINYGYDSSNFTSKIEEVTCDMSSYIKFKNIFGSDFNSNKDLIEEIIKDITIFEDKNILENRLKNIYHLDNEKIKSIKSLNYKGYATLSKHLLSEFTSTDKETGEIYGPIIQIMRDENINLQQILNDQRFHFMDAINEYNLQQMDKNQSVNEFIEENLYVSPIMKRSLLQAYKLIEEIENILKHKIDYYYVECTRTNKEKKVASVSRYNRLKDFYNNCKKQAAELSKFNIDINRLSESLEKNKENLRWDALYLYYTQLGKCLYTLKDIDISKITESFFDVDHIYPQSIIKDDSMNNRVLVDSYFNRHNKSSKFLFEIPGFLTSNKIALYDKLLELELITKEKYRRLTQTSMTNNELDGFVNRQIVATNQAVKGLIELLKQYKGVNQSHIIYSKAENISDFRQKFDCVKSRVANNYHHAHDAYLNVVIGRVINDYYVMKHFYGEKDLERIKNEQSTINPRIILSTSKITNPITGNVIWDKDNIIKLIKKNLYERFDIHETIKPYTSGKMFKKVSITSNGKIPIKTSDARKDVDKYGGMTSPSYCKYCIVKLIEEKNKTTTYKLEAIPTTYRDRIQQYVELIYNKEYCSIEIINDNILTNVIVEEDKKRYCITGKTNESYVIQNRKDRNFSYEDISIIKKIEKYFDNKKMSINMNVTPSLIEIAKEDKIKKRKGIVLSLDECKILFEEIKSMYHKDIYNYSIINKICLQLDNNKREFSIEEYVVLINELLILLKTNERSTANLRLINLPTSTGTLTINRTLKPGMKFISESITGYYSKLIFEVPSGL